MEESKLTENIIIKSIELENEGNKYKCKIQIIKQILNIVYDHIQVLFKIYYKYLILLNYK